MPTDTRALVEGAARALLRALADTPDRSPLRVADADGGRACLILVWNAAEAMPTAAAERRRREGHPRGQCKQDIVEAIRAAGRPLVRKEVLKALRAAGGRYGASTVVKALAELSKSGELVNPKDKLGYRLPAWRRRADTPSLF